MGVRSMLSTSRSEAKSPSVNWPSLLQDRASGRGLGAARLSSGMLRRHRRFFALAVFSLVGDAARGRARQAGQRRVDPEGGAQSGAGAEIARQSRRLADASERDRRLSQGPLWPAGENDPPAQGSDQSRSVRGQQRHSGDRRQRANVCGARRYGRAKRRPRVPSSEGGRGGRHDRGDERRARAARRQVSGRPAAEFLDHLPGRSSELGAKPRQEDRV